MWERCGQKGGIECNRHAGAAGKERFALAMGSACCAPSGLLTHGRPIFPHQGNKLGTAFIEATERTGATAWHDLFDTSIFEIKHAGEAGRHL